MRWQIILLFMALTLGASCASAFPLSGASGQASITVFGTIGVDLDEEMTRIYVDVGAPNGYMGSVSLVDDEDKFYNPGNADSPFTPNIGWGKVRFFIPFDVPKGTVIKRLKFEPDFNGNLGEPFSINWESIPEVSDDRFKLKMYGVKSNNPDIRIQLSPNQKAWTFDLKLTNNLTTNMPVSVKDFSMVDQYGWVYDKPVHLGSVDLGQLISGESMRFDLTFSPISGLSRPVVLKYKNLSLDISA